MNMVFNLESYLKMNNQTYKITSLETKSTSTGKSYKKVTLEGVEKAVSLWSDFPRYADLQVGSEIVGELKTNDKGYLNLYPPRTGSQRPQNGSGSTFKAKMMDETMAKKQGYIQEAQGNKELGIKTSSTMRDAVLCALATHSTLNNGTADLEASILRWRKWLWAHWEDTEKYPPFFSGEEKSPDEQYADLGEPEIPWS